MSYLHYYQQQQLLQQLQKTTRGRKTDYNSHISILDINKIIVITVCRYSYSIRISIQVVKFYIVHCDHIHKYITNTDDTQITKAIPEYSSHRCINIAWHFFG